jgi:hypothetical protein
MGTRWSVTVWHALSDFEGTEREFLEKVCDEVFEPMPADDEGGDEYGLEIRERRRRFHHGHGLPGSDRDWMTVAARDWRGERYLTAGNHVPEVLIPPFPRVFAGTHWIYRKLPLPTPWHVLFGAAGRDLQESRIFVRLEAARQHFHEAFGGIGRLLDWASRRPEEFREKTPRFADGWSIVRKLLSLYDPEEYMQVIRMISGGHGGRAVLELDFDEEVRPDDDDPGVMKSRRERFLAENEALNRILRSARGLDLAAIAREVPIRVGYIDDLYAIVRWLIHYHRDFVRPFVKSILTEDERSRSVEGVLF